MKEPTKIAARRAREQRLRSALRENLKRRKAQSRGREPDPREEPGGAPDRPSEGEKGPS